MDRISFKVNGVEHSVGCEVSSDVSLLDYLRNTLELRGTKYMCREAGCGACIVSAVKSSDTVPLAINSCMVSVTSCQDWDITTVENIGNKLNGYHILQTTLAKYHGTQCGHCTPGWIMAMYSLLKSKRSLTMLEIEKSFGSNVCRCTGYRPILEAFKKFASDSPDPHSIFDIEDLHVCKNNCKKECKRNVKKVQNIDDSWDFVSSDHIKCNNIIEIDLKDCKKWYKVFTLSDLFDVVCNEGDSYQLIAGNTAKGAYPINEYPRALIDISGVAELKGYLLDQNLVIGAGTTLTELMDIFQQFAKEQYFAYLQKLHDHLELVAHIAVRNLGSIAGNLMIKHQHKEFPSDVFLLFETVGAQLTIQNHHGNNKIVKMQEFLSLDMTMKVILQVMLPPRSSNYRLSTFKIMPRSQNVVAVVNAGFSYKLDPKNDQVIECRIVYGGLSPTFIRATATETYLIGKKLFTNDTLQLAMKKLKSELVVVKNPPEPSVEYRKQLAINLFYKGLLKLCPVELIQSRYRSGATNIQETRPVSKGKQTYDTDRTLWPLNEPVQKLEALIQCSGEAVYTEDLPSFPRETFACFVLSTVPTGNLVNIDPSVALKQPGVIQFYSAKDIPGLNSFTPAEVLTFTSNEEVLCDGVVKYFNQPIGIIVAESRAIAERAAKMVTATYKNVTKPVINIKVAMKDTSRTILFQEINATDKGTDVVKVIKCDFLMCGQYHFTMETLTCVTKPTEEGLEVHAATQHTDGVHLMVSRALKMDQSRIDVHVRRLGGAYGMKVSRATQGAIASCLAAKDLNRPCRFIQSLTSNMRAVGKRFPFSTDFEVGVNSVGVIQYINYNVYEDNGYKVNEVVALLGPDSFFNCYNRSRWNYKVYNTITDTAKNTYCRAPGTFEHISMAEWVMERISYELSRDSLEIRLANLDTNYKDLLAMADTLKSDSNYTERKIAVAKYNQENKWKKRGLRSALLRWKSQIPQYLDINMSVYHGDGTVAMAHGGIEMGQGVNTKAAQVCAHLLKIPLNKIQIKPNNTTIGPNAFISGGSVTSQNVSIGVRRCCETLLTRLEPVRSQMTNPTWVELIQKAYSMDIDLQVHGFTNINDLQTLNSDCYAVAFAEVEIDILTGELGVLRVDLAEDVGQSINPEIDVGQVEGAFMMGQGYWTSENLVYKEDTGEVLTDRAWNYHVPLARDIPQDFRVYFRKKSYSNDIVFGAKVTGEPPICLSVVVPFAIREAIAAARLESGKPTTEWFEIDGPYTSEKICMSAATRIEDFKFC